MSDKIREFLGSAGLEKYLEIFTSQGIELEYLKEITPFLLDKLISPIGDQLRFYTALKRLESREPLALSPAPQGQSSKSNNLATTITGPSSAPSISLQTKSPPSTPSCSFHTSDEGQNEETIQEPPPKKFKSQNTSDNAKIFSNVEAMYDFLSGAPGSELAIRQFNKDGYLNAISQDSLKNTLAFKIIATYGRSIPSAVYKNCQIYIKEIFPTDQGGWYVLLLTEGRNQKIAEGKLVARVRNLLLSVEIREIAIGPDQVERQNAVSINDLIAEDVYAEHKTYLSHHSQPWTKTEDLWRKTSPNRLVESSNDKLSLASILKIWPLYKHPMGYCLINIDFDVKFPNKESIFLTGWIRNAEKLADILKRSLSETKYPSVLRLKEATENDNNVTRDATTLELLPVILPPSIIHEPLSETEETAEKRKGKGKGRGKGRGKNNCSTQIRKPTIVESQLSFIIICKTAAEMKAEITKIQQVRQKSGRDLQPFIIFVGEEPSELRNFYVYFEGVTYEVDTPLAAVEICFKVFHVLSLAYPTDCVNIWMFIQKQFFSIDIDTDIIPSVVTTLMSQL